MDQSASCHLQIPIASYNTTDGMVVGIHVCMWSHGHTLSLTSIPAVLIRNKKNVGIVEPVFCLVICLFLLYFFGMGGGGGGSDRLAKIDDKFQIWEFPPIKGLNK